MVWCWVFLFVVRLFLSISEVMSKRRREEGEAKTFRAERWQLSIRRICCRHPLDRGQIRKTSAPGFRLMVWFVGFPSGSLRPISPSPPPKLKGLSFWFVLCQLLQENGNHTREWRKIVASFAFFREGKNYVVIFGACRKNHGMLRSNF